MAVPLCGVDLVSTIQYIDEVSSFSKYMVKILKEFKKKTYICGSSKKSIVKCQKEVILSVTVPLTLIVLRDGGRVTNVLSFN